MFFRKNEIFSNKFGIDEKDLKISKEFDNFDFDYRKAKYLIFSNYNHIEYGNFLFVAGFPNGSIKVFLNYETINDIHYHNVFNKLMKLC